MPGVGAGYHGNHNARGGAQRLGHDGYDPYSADPSKSPKYDPYSGGPSKSPKYDPYSQSAKEDPYPSPMSRSYSNEHEDPYASRPPMSYDHPYPRYGKPEPGKLEDPYGRNGRVEDVYSHVDKGRRPNGVGPPVNDYHHNARNYSEAESGASPSGQYEMDHLATFTVGAKQGLMSPADGIRKLRQMEMSTGIWTMRVVLIVESRDLVIIDRASQEEMERFPVTLILEPTAVTNEDRRDVYNNIVLFTVTEDPHRGAPSEMHMFQCVGKPAHEVVDNIKSAKAGNVRSSGPVRDHVELRAGPSHVMEEYEQHAQANFEAYKGYPPDVRGSTFVKPSMNDNESVVSERTDRDVQLLNHCFDDIERFVGRLQYAAEAYRQLADRRRGRDDRRNRHSMGDGMLSMRARPPPAKDFIDIFQKFKLSFNLLAKLKPHIHDPNAPELVHFLFTPLNLVVEASKDPRRGTPEIAAKCVSPLLTYDAKDLLMNCLTSKETDLWDSLGEAWKLNREEWRDNAPPFYPRFSDGWEPPRSWNAEASQSSPEQESLYGQRNGQPTYSGTTPHREEPSYPHREEPSYRGGPHQPHREDTYDRTAAPVTSQEAHDRAIAEYQQEMRRRQENRERQETDRQRMQPQPRQREPEHVDPREREPKHSHEDSRQLHPYDKHDDFLSKLQARNAKAFEVLHAREGRNQKELTIEKGEIVEVLDDTRNWWKVRNAKGETGHVPYTILQESRSVNHGPVRRQ